MTDHPQLYSAYFLCARHGDRYDRLARVLKHTAQKHCGDWNVLIERVAAPITSKDHARRYGSATNSDKLDAWVRFVLKQPDGARVLLIDTDTFIRKPLDSVWDMPFDVAVTVKPWCRSFPINGGVVFVRVNDVSRHFFERWGDINRRMYQSQSMHAPWRSKYGGMNQAALGYLLEQEKLTVTRLLCKEWNACEPHTWHSWRHSRIVHVKSRLRNAVFSGMHHRRELNAIVETWKALEKEAKALGRDPKAVA